MIEFFEARGGSNNTGCRLRWKQQYELHVPFERPFGRMAMHRHTHFNGMRCD